MAYQSEVDFATVASIQTIFQRSKLSRAGWQSRLMDGRLDARQAWRYEARGHVDIFKDRQAQSTTKVNVWLLVDASGSMGGALARPRLQAGRMVATKTRAMNAQDTAATLAQAFRRIPTVRLHIYQHSASGDGEMYLRRAYGDGLNRVEGMAAWGRGGGNADGFALQWVGQQALRNPRPDERTIIIVISDGLPSVHGAHATNPDLISFSASVAEDIRRRGAAVLSVSIEGDGHRSESRDMYGAENVVPFKASSPTAWPDLARGLAEMFGRVLR